MSVRESDSERLSNAIASLLAEADFPSDFKSEEKELEPYVVKLLEPTVQNGFPGVRMFTSVGGEAGTSPSVRVCGTDFWQDIVFHTEDPDRRLVAVELKLVKDRKLPSAISGVVGQCLINQLEYERTVGFILTYAEGRRDEAYHEKDNQLADLLKARGIDLVVRFALPPSV